jgi:type IV pilus modification protein PilV
MKLINYSNKSQSGSTLIEVLITMLVTAIALLGLAGMQVRAQQEHRIAHLRMIAIEKGNQLLEEARNTYRYSRDGNTAYVRYPTSNTPGMPTNTCGLIPSNASTGSGASTTACSDDQMWLSMRQIWTRDLRAKLPGSAFLLTHTDDIDAVGLGSLGAAYTSVSALDVAKHPVLTVTIAWKEPQTDSNMIDNSCAMSGDASFTAAVAGYRCVFLTTNL